MRFFLFFFFLLIRAETLLAQLKPLDYCAPTIWPIIKSPQISNNGNYLAYKINILDKGFSFIVQATNNSWRREILANCEDFQFTKDSRHLIFRRVDSMVGIFDIFKDSLYYVGPIKSFEVPKEGGQWLACLERSDCKDLILINLFNGKEILYSHVQEYKFSPSGNALLIVAEIKKKRDSITTNVVLWRNLAEGKDTVISRGLVAKNFIFNNPGTKLIFWTDNGMGDQRISSFRYYQPGMDSARILIDSSTEGMEEMTLKEDYPFFSPLCDRVFFYIGELKSINKISDPAYQTQVNILNYQDDSLQLTRRQNSYLATFDLLGQRKVIRLQQPEDNYFSLSEMDDDRYIFFESDIVGSTRDYGWRKSARPDIYLVSVKDGTRKLLKRRLITYNLSFSLAGKYVLWFDREQGEWVSYNIAQGQMKNITKKITTSLNYDSDYPSLPMAEGLVGWLENDLSVFIYDRFDIWKVDPNAEKPPINLTKGFGARNNIRLRLINFNRDTLKAFSAKDTLLLTAFDYTTKYNGFCKIPLNNNSDLKLLAMGPVVYYSHDLRVDLGGASDLFYPIKAKNANTYIVSRMSIADYPNLYLTNDFKTYENLTKLAPQKDYKWYKSELVHWILPDGKGAEGILYKPIDFQPSKKYPIIFYYYEKNAVGLNVFIHSQFSNGVMNIPWFVSNGYLVFVPDIYYKVGHPGESAYNSVVSAALFMSKKSWVDSHKMGLQGHSFGGWETNYIITRTNLFSAAASASGYSDIVTSYGENLPDGSYYELLQGRIGSSLWQNPKLYIENSPFFMADKVSTPLLILQNKNDGIVTYWQGDSWYHALQRLGKKVWMLSYDGEGHTIDKSENQLDYSVRLSEFFDYYLKDKLPPKWMTK